MSLGNNYNSNQKAPNNYSPISVTYSPVSFSNPESGVCASKLNISYFNRLLKIGIALKNPKNKNDNYDTYDNENQAAVYVSYSKAKMLYDLIEILKQKEDIHNVSIELKNGLLTVSDGSEFGTKSPCIVIRSANNDGNINTVIYETKLNYHKGALNYDADKNTYEDYFFNTIELDTIQTVLIEYYKASTYAIAASVGESFMYKMDSFNNRINAIANKVGAVSNGYNKSGNNKSFLSGGSSEASHSSSMNNVPKEYEQSSFDDIASAYGD